MKKLSLFKIIVFYLMIGILALEVIDSIIDWSSGNILNKDVVKLYLYKDLAFLVAAAVVIYFSVSYYKKNYQTTELNYQKLFAGSPLPMYIMAKGSLKILAVNDAMVKLYGYSAAEFLRMTSYDIRPEAERKRIKDFLLQYGETVNDSGSWLHQKKNGECFFVKVNFHVIPSLKEDAYLVMVTDIDKSINDEKKIKDLIHLYETVNRATNDVIWDYNLVEDKLNWMQGYYETYGYTKESSPNIFWGMQKIHADDRERVHLSFKEVLYHKQTDWVAEYRYICADGSLKYVRDRGYVIFDEHGVPIRMIGAIQDIDRQKRFEQQLLQQNEQLKEIAWINSHQVRRPLSNILGLIDLIKDSSAKHEDIIEYIELLSVSSKELDEAVVLINRQTLDGNVTSLN